MSVPPSHRKTRKVKRTGRHCAPSKAQKTAKIIGVSTPVVALAGVIALGQTHPQPLDPVASSMASYHLHSKAAGTGITKIAQSGSAEPAASASASAAAHASKPTPSASSANAGKTASPSPAASSQPSPSPRPSPSSAPTTPTALTCSGTPGTGMLPLNYVTIVNFLIDNGYTEMAAAGIAGNIYQESDGDPEAVGTGGGGLIGWTPLPAGFVTGNPAADLQTQLSALLTYNQQWAQYIPMLNAATNPTDAADIYMNYFERPGVPAAANREGAANAVAQACGITS